uniref:Late embryogenesis abundant protein n=1 Tax=Panagrolaimus superbus TaxID=310955 RepID=A0A914ZDI9_9BILA
MAAEKAREMTQYVTGAVLNTAEDVKEMATDDGEQKDVTKNESVDKEKKLQQPWDIGAPSSLPGPTESDGLKYGCKPASPEEISNSSRHALAHPTSSLKTF